MAALLVPQSRLLVDHWYSRQSVAVFYDIQDATSIYRAIILFQDHIFLLTLWQARGQVRRCISRETQSVC